MKKDSWITETDCLFKSNKKETLTVCLIKIICIFAM